MTSRFPPVSLPDSPYARGLQSHCLSLPGAWEDYPWGDIVYKVGAKMFAATGTALPLTVTVKAMPEDADVLVQLPHVSRAAYVGRHGWVSVQVSDEVTLDHAKELFQASYDLVRAKSGRVRVGGRRR